MAPVIENVSDAVNVHPLAISAIPALFGLVGVYALPETLNQNLKNWIILIKYLYINFYIKKL